MGEAFHHPTISPTAHGHGMSARVGSLRVDWSGTHTAMFTVNCQLCRFASRYQMHVEFDLEWPKLPHLQNVMGQSLSGDSVVTVQANDQFVFSHLLNNNLTPVSATNSLDKFLDAA